MINSTLRLEVKSDEVIATITPPSKLWTRLIYSVLWVIATILVALGLFSNNGVNNFWKFVGIVLWLLYVGMFLFTWLQMTGTREIITVDHSTLSIREDFFGLGRKREYKLSNSYDFHTAIEHPRLSHIVRLPLSELAQETIVFYDRFITRHTFGRGLSEQDAKQLIQKIVEFK